MTFQVESMTAIRTELEELFPDHWREMHAYDSSGPIDVDWKAYQLLEELGFLLTVTAREEGELAGYFVSFIRSHMHNRRMLVAMSDMYYLHPDYRKGRNGIEFIKAVEREWQKLRVSLAVMTCKSFSDHSIIFERLGYEFEEKTFIKNLEAA